MVIMYTKYSPRKFTSFPEKIAIGIVTSPSCFIGIINNKTPIREGIMNFNLSFKETLVLSLSNGFKFETWNWKNLLLKVILVIKITIGTKESTKLVHKLVKLALYNEKEKNI